MNLGKPGRKLASEWSQVVSVNNETHCKHCDAKLSARIKRIRKHLKNCRAAKEDQNGSVEQNANIYFEEPTGSASVSSAQEEIPVPISGKKKQKIRNVLYMIYFLF